MTDINQTTSISSIMNQFKTDNYGMLNAKEELEGLFAEQNICATDDELEKVNDKIKNLEDRIKALAKRAEQIKKDIAEREEIINETNGKLLVLINNINAGTREYKDYVDKAVLVATNAAARTTGKNAATHSDKEFKKIFNTELKSQLTRLPGVKQEDIQAWYKEYEALQNNSTFTNALSDLNKYSGELNKLQTQLRNTNGTINFLSATRNSLAGTTITKTGAYKNVDADVKPPIYSGAKQDVATDILCKDYSTDSFKVTQTKEEAKAKYLPTGENAYSGSGDRHYWKTNPALNYLHEMGEDGIKNMFTELHEAGMSTDDIVEWLRDSWQIGTKNSLKKEDGVWKVPYGHGSSGHQDRSDTKYAADNDGKSHETYEWLANAISQEYSSNSANTYNAESVSKLMDAVNNDKILDTMAEKGFTFKEAMYVIKQTFGDDCGIEYILDDQANGAKYGVASDTKESGTFFKDFASKVKNIWGIEAGQATNKSSAEVEAKRTDPMTFQQDNTTYTFLAKDALDDKRFNGSSELLGANKGMEEWAAFDTDGNGKIDGDELKNVFLMKNVQNESSHDKASITDTNTVDFTANFMSAAELGITEINYTDLSDTTNVGKKNINGSEIQSNFKITTDGKKLDENITAQQTQAPQEYLDVFYNALANTEDITVKQTFANFSKDQIDDFFNNWYSMQVEVDGKDMGLGALDNYITGLMKNIKDLIDKYTDEPGTSDRYDLNIDYAEFQKWYSGNPIDSLYVQKASKIAKEVGYEHRADDGNYASERVLTQQAVQDAIDNYEDENGIIGLGKVDIKDGVTRKAVHTEGNEWLKKHENNAAVKKWATDNHLKIIKEEDVDK